MKFTQAVSSCLKKYATFSGRATRSEFWWFYLFTILVTSGVTWIGNVMFPLEPHIASGLSALVNFLFLLPILAAGARRLHDIGRSGWWQLLIITGIGYLLLLIGWAMKSKMDDNKFGPVEGEHGAVVE